MVLIILLGIIFSIDLMEYYDKKTCKIVPTDLIVIYLLSPVAMLMSPSAIGGDETTSNISGLSVGFDFSHNGLVNTSDGQRPKQFFFN